MKLRKAVGALVLALVIISNTMTAFAANITGAKPAVTPIVVAADGTQMMGPCIVSRPLYMYKMEAVPKILAPGGKAGWEQRNGHWQVRNAEGKLLSGRVLVSDTLTKSGIGNVSMYYFDTSGYMQLGWQWVQVNGKWYLYYFNEEDGPLLGAMFAGGVKDGRELDAYGRVTVNGVVQEFNSKPN